MIFSFKQVFENLKINKHRREFPSRTDARCADRLLWPSIQPGFHIDPSSKPAIFTIGSCFARNIENALAPLGFVLPTWQFVTPEHELAGRGPHGMLNEFNPGSIGQRILYALDDREFDEQTLVPAPGGTFADLLLVRGTDVKWERAIERRREVRDVYRQLARSHYVLMTLGLSEAWYDHEASIYLNRMPPHAVMQASPERYSLLKLDADHSYQLLEPAIAALVARRINVLLTVSPVPLTTTMTRADAVIANEASKASLRTCVDRLCARFPGVDYFPSYEIVRSGGLDSYLDDNIHVKPALIHRVTKYMVDAYCAAPVTAPAVQSREPVLAGYYDGH